MRVQNHRFRSLELISPRNASLTKFKDTDTGATIFRRLIGDEVFPDADERSLFL